MTPGPKVALITGSSGGLGHAIALELARSGMDTALHCYRHSEELAELQNVIVALGRRAVIVTADLRDAKAAEEMVQDVLDKLGRIHVLIHSAGISRDGVAWKLRPEDWENVLSTNLTGTFHSTRAVLPTMREHAEGRILSISSVVGQMGIAGTAAYAASKAALSGFSRAVAREVAAKNITVNVLALGYYSVGMIHTISAEQQEKILEQIPLRRFGDPRELGQLVAFLCTDAASYITGQTINVNGGIYM